VLTIESWPASTSVYRDGLIFNSFWEKLSQRQQLWLLNVGTGKENKEKLIEETKNNIVI
jgi:hypothetical protein